MDFNRFLHHQTLNYPTKPILEKPLYYFAMDSTRSSDSDDDCYEVKRKYKQSFLQLTVFIHDCTGGYCESKY